MMTAAELESAAQQALAQMRRAGFEHAQVSACALALTELNANDNLPSLLRSTESCKLVLLGIAEGRMASTELAETAPAAVQQSVAALFADLRSAPQDAANAVSAGQQARIEQGPQAADGEALADALGELLAFRARATPKMSLREAFASHRLQRTHLLTTGGSDIACSVGWYELMAFGSAREGERSSSLNYAEGRTHDLRVAPAPEQFGIGAMLRDTERQIVTRPFGDKFVGDVVLMPNAVADLLGWLLGQLGDQALIAGSSLYRERVGQPIAAAPFTLRSWFDAPGVAAVSGDAFVAPPVCVVEGGVLRALLPTFYGSRKTGLSHVPTAAGWQIAPGETPLPQLIGGVQRGALVGRLSMGMPAANGNFSGVIKNSFAIERGETGHALAEVMISGNMAQMLRDVLAVSRETLDASGWRLPWLRIGGLHFS